MRLFHHLIHLTNDPALLDGFHEVSDDEMSRDPAEPPVPIDFQPLVDAGRTALLWLVDVARSRTQDADDLAAIGRVDASARASLEGVPCPARARASEEDILVVLGILITAFETNFRIPGLSELFGALYDGADDLADQAIAAMHAEARKRGSGGGSAPPVIPVVIHRRPRVAHGVDGDAPLRSILIVR